MPARELLETIWGTIGGAAALTSSVTMTGEGALPSAFAVTDLATASIGAAGLAIAELIAAGRGNAGRVTVDRRLASFWFGWTLRPDGWSPPPAWDPIAGDYLARDGWIRLHTNAPHHRAAALAVLLCPAEKDAVAAAVLQWTKDDLEAAVVAGGGCAAAMRDLRAWTDHPQGRALASEDLVWREARDPAPPWALPNADRPLRGVRVLDLTRVLAGPVATRFLAGFGADVLRIDPPDWDEAGVIPEVTLGKRCARLDLRQPAARRVLAGLLSQADILVHGYRPEALARMGLDAAARRRIRPGLIDICLDAYGWTGPWRQRRGFDSLVQMSTGIAGEGMRHYGADRPAPLPVQALDHATGYLLAAAAIRGLTERLTTGLGSEARASLARTAGLLTAAGAGDSRPLAAVTDADFSDMPEATSWGPAHRMRPPLVVEGAAMIWDWPATVLGTADPVWLPRRSVIRSGGHT